MSTRFDKYIIIGITMFEFIIGLAVGTSFAPFWMMVWEYIKPKIMSVVGKKKTEL